MFFLGKLKQSNKNYVIHANKIYIYFYSLLTTHGTGYEIFIDTNGKIFVGILTRKEYYAASVSGASLVDKK